MKTRKNELSEIGMRVFRYHSAAVAAATANFRQDLCTFIVNEIAIICVAM